MEGEGGSQPQEAQPQGLPICPRCGQPYRYLERRRIGNNVYYYAVHYEGYERGPDGRPRPKLRRCYLGPNVYVEVTKTHSDLGITFKGLIEEGRERDYINALAEAIEARLREGSLRPEEALEFAKSLDRLAELARRLRDYAAAKSSAKATAEVVDVTAPRQAAEARQGEAEARKAASAQGTEDIEREVKEVLEELKASH